MLIICFKCGYQKSQVLSACQHCGSLPKAYGERSQSLVLSEYISSKDQLSQFATDIRIGLRFNPSEIIYQKSRELMKDTQFIVKLDEEADDVALNKKSAENKTSLHLEDNTRKVESLRRTTLHKSPFFLLGVTTRDSRKKIIEIAEEKILTLDQDICMKARSDLTNARFRLGLEMAWLPGVSPGKVERLLNQLLQDPMGIRFESGLPVLARANLMAAALEILPSQKPGSMAEWILELSRVYEAIDPEEVSAMLNEERVVSGFPEIADLSVVEAEVQERRRYYRQVIKTALDGLSTLELVEAVTVAVGFATKDGEDHGPVLIADLVDSYEVEAQGFLDKEEEVIRTLAEKVRGAVDDEQPDSILAPMVNQLMKVVKNWDSVAQPIQLSVKSRGLDHDASHRVAGLVRGLAVHMFNKHGKLEFSQQLTKMLQVLFAEVGDVAERAAEDAEALDEIAEQRVFLSEVSKIEELTTQIKADSGRLDSYLSPKVGQLCQLILNLEVDPEHDASQHAAWIVRDLAIHMFNKHDKLDHSLQLTKTLIRVFKDVDEIFERISEDVKVLQEIASSRTKLLSQFRDFNLNGSSFSYKGSKYNITDILHIGFYRAITTHKTNFIETGKTEQVSMFLSMSGGQELKISVDEQGFFFNKNKSEQINTIVEFYSYLSHVTFDRRLDFYESQINKYGFFEYDKCNFFPRVKIVFRGRDFGLSSTTFLRGYGYVEMRNKDYGILDKIKREVPLTKIPQFRTVIDTDVIFHLLDKHFSLRWNS